VLPPTLGIGMAVISFAIMLNTCWYDTEPSNVIHKWLRAQSVNNKDIILILGYNYNLHEEGEVEILTCPTLLFPFSIVMYFNFFILIGNEANWRATHDCNHKEAKELMKFYKKPMKCESYVVTIRHIGIFQFYICM